MVTKKNASLDSLKIKISTTFIEFTELGTSTLVDKYVMVNSVTGELFDGLDQDSWKRNRCNESHNGISSSFIIHKVGHNQGHDSDSKEDLVISINSKMLKSKYMQGITKDNVIDVYNYIMSFGFFTISFDYFLKYSRCTDIDVKVDSYGMNRDNTKNFFEGLNRISRSSGITTNANKNLMIAYSHRANESKIINNPFVKFYHKWIELKHHSLEFYQEFLATEYGSIDSIDNKLKDVCRLEGTIKNREHFNSLLKNINHPEIGTSLEELLSISESNLKLILSQLLNKHIKASNKVSTMQQMNMKNNSVSVIDLAWISAIKLALLEGGNIETFTFDTCQNMSRNSRYQYKKKFKDLHQEYLINDIEVKEVDTFKETLRGFLNMA